MKNKLSELDKKSREKYLLSIEEYLELLEHFESFTKEEQETMKLWGIFGNQFVHLPYSSIEFSKIIEEEYGSDIDSFLAMNAEIEELSISKDELLEFLNI